MEILKKSLAYNSLKWWKEENNDLIYFSGVTPGMSGTAWLAHFKVTKKPVHFLAESLLLENLAESESVPIEGVVIPGYAGFFKDKPFESKLRMHPQRIQSRAEKADYSSATLEMACMAFSMFSMADMREMGVRWLAVMHKPLNLRAFRNMYLLNIMHKGDEMRLEASEVRFTEWAIHEGGFIFERKDKISKN